MMIEDLNSMILAGKGLEAFDKYYGDTVTMQENADELRVGKAANRAYEEAFFGGVTAFEGKVLNVAVGENVSMVEWYMDITHKDWGNAKRSQVAVQTWKDGKIVSEKFYYKG
jgi:hypothetical protein